MSDNPDQGGALKQQIEIVDAKLSLLASRVQNLEVARTVAKEARLQPEEFPSPSDEP